MKDLTQENARMYALEKFKQMSDLHFKWNSIHSEAIIEILKIIGVGKIQNLDKLCALAWIHDVGKIVSEKNHAKLSLDILEKEFYLDEIDKDCILNHGTLGNPKTEQGKIFRYADGLSLFTNKMIRFKFSVESEEGLSFEEIKSRLAIQYNKYKEKYSDSEYILKLLDDLYCENVI